MKIVVANTRLPFVRFGRRDVCVVCAASPKEPWTFVFTSGAGHDFLHVLACAACTGPKGDKGRPTTCPLPVLTVALRAALDADAKIDGVWMAKDAEAGCLELLAEAAERGIA